MHDETQDRTNGEMRGEEGDLARLLTAAGPRSRPAPEAEATVRTAVEAEWRRIVVTRQRRRPALAWAAAASVAVGAVALWMARPMVSSPGADVAAVDRVVGDVEQSGGDGRWTRLVAGAVITAGTEIRSGGDGRAALALRDGVRLRLDTRTQLALDDATHASLSRGAVYVDSGPPAGHKSQDLLLATPLGEIHHLGTQYEARLSDGTLSVGVREGRVQVDGGAGQVTATAGERLTVTPDAVAKSTLGRSAAEWDWIAAVTPAFSIEGRSVDAFLAWAGRETGRQVIYSSSDLAQRARDITLSGTISGLTPEQAIGAVLVTTSLTPVIVDGEIRIEPAAAP